MKGKLIVVGLTGFAGAGKDYIFGKLKESFPYEAVRVSLADEVRHEIEEVFQKGLPQLWEKPYPLEIRKLLQWWGTDLRRKEDEDYWVRKTEAFIPQLHKMRTPYDTIVVVTDVRFPNELAMVKRLGGIMVKVVASPFVRASRLGLDPLQMTHASEAQIGALIPDRVILNDGAPERLESTYAGLVVELARKLQ